MTTATLSFQDLSIPMFWFSIRMQDGLTYNAFKVESNDDLSKLLPMVGLMIGDENVPGFLSDIKEVSDGTDHSKDALMVNFQDNMTRISYMRLPKDEPLLTRAEEKYAERDAKKKVVA